MRIEGCDVARLEELEMSNNHFPELTPYSFTVTLRPYGDDPNAGIVQIDPQARYGYWEFKDGCEGGGLWFESTEDGLMLTDFDGHYDLPHQVYRALTEAGFKLDEFMGAEQ